MVKLQYILVMVSMAVASTPVFAGWKVVIGRNCIKVVAANIASQKLIEDQHNQRLDPITSKKQKVELYPVSMAAIKELYKLTMENTPSFGTESLYYKEIDTYAFDTLKGVPELINTVNKTKFKNELVYLTKLDGPMTETQRLAGNSVNIVNSVEVQSPLEEQSTAEKEGGGCNLLNRYKRLSLVNRIYTDLMEIRYKVKDMMLTAQFAAANNLLFAVDPEDQTNVVAMKNQTDDLVQDWNGPVVANY